MFVYTLTQFSVFQCLLLTLRSVVSTTIKSSPNGSCCQLTLAICKNNKHRPLSALLSSIAEKLVHTPALTIPLPLPPLKLALTSSCPRRYRSHFVCRFPMSLSRRSSFWLSLLTCQTRFSGSSPNDRNRCLHWNI